MREAEEVANREAQRWKGAEHGGGGIGAAPCILC